jgi:branched-chain amino acid transport system substrate-binding protein
MQPSRYSARFILLISSMGWLLLSLWTSIAQSTPVFRVGVLANPNSALAHGAALAVERLNQAGGVRGADGTFFRLELVFQPINELDPAASISNLGQASVIAVIGPETSAEALPNIAALQSLGVPVLTTATDDTLLARDNADVILRVRAQEALQGRALASYLVSDLAVSSVVTVQLDLESTASVVGFSTAMSGLGQPVQQTLLFDQMNPIPRIAQRIVQANPQVVAAYGPPSLASELYLLLREADWGGIFAYNRASEAAFRNIVPTPLLRGIVTTSTWSYALNSPISREFVTLYLRAFGEVPNEIAAASYDAVTLLAQAISQPGDLLTNLYGLSNVAGVQGLLNPALLTRGETSNNVVVMELGPFGAPFPTALFAGNQRLPIDEVEFALATPTPAPTATPEGAFITITRNVQNVRSGPGTNYDVIGQLQRGETAPVIGANVDLSWVVISFRGVNGWLSTDILTLTGDRRQIPIIEPPPTPTPLPPTATPTPSPVADIVILAATPNRLTLGAPFNVIVTVANQGLLPAGPFAVASSLNPGGVFSAVNLPGLAAGQQTNVVLSGTLGTGSTGPQSVIIVADLNNEVSEGPAGEANNNVFAYNYIADAPLFTGKLEAKTSSTVEAGSRRWGALSSWCSAAMPTSTVCTSTPRTQHLSPHRLSCSRLVKSSQSRQTELTKSSCCR